MTNRVCFVLDELFPYTKGGIGRLMWNIIQDSLRREPKFTAHILWAAAGALPKSESSRLIFHALPAYSPASDGDGIYAPEDQYNSVWPLGTSLRICKALKALEKDFGAFNAIEFPDFRGWSFSTSSERILGTAFRDTPIVVRAHGSAAVIAHFEGTMPSRGNLKLYDIERKSFEMADIVISHVGAVWKDYERIYQFSKSINPRVEFPQAVYPIPPKPILPAEGFQDIVFAGRYLKIKRPDLFVRGAIAFLRSTPRFRGVVYLCAFASEEQIAVQCRALVPEDLKDRFVFSSDKDVRAKAMSRGNVMVIPSEFEGLNLVLYESAAEGMALILNSNCSAFQQPKRFLDGKNCFFFDGTIDGLTATLIRAYKSKLTETIPLHQDEPYFFKLSRECLRMPIQESSEARRKTDLSVVVLLHDRINFLPTTLESVLRSVNVRTEIIVVGNGTTNPKHTKLLDDIAWRCAEAGVRIVQGKGTPSLAALRNFGAKLGTAPHLFFIDVGDLVSPTFLSRAVSCLDQHPDYDVVVPNIGYFRDDVDARARKFHDFSVYIGDATNVGWLENRCSSGSAVIRRRIFEEVKFDEDLAPYEDWTFFLELAARKKRFLVTNQVALFRRENNRSNGLTRNPEQERAVVARMQYQVARRTGVRPPIDVVACTAGGESRSPNLSTPMIVVDEPNLAIVVVDKLNNLLKRFPTQHAFAKRALQKLGYGYSEKPLRHDLVEKFYSKISRAPDLLRLIRRVSTPT